MRAFLGLGANLGERLGTLQGAAQAIGGLGPVPARSQIYETAPACGPPQPDYLNAALVLETEMAPDALLAALLGIEAEFGRVRQPGQRNLPRTLDLDILLLGDRGERVLSQPALIVPHPRLHLRTFALLPLLDVAPDLVHPLLDLPLETLYQRLLLSEIPPRQVPGSLS